MELFVINHRFSTCFRSRFLSVFAFLSALTLLSSCAPIGRYPSMTTGEPKNTLPFFDKGRVEELYSIAVPPFASDQHNWNELAVEILSSSKRISVTPSRKINAELKNSKGDLSSLRPEERPGFLAALGRTVKTDAVINGVILDKEQQHEIILQVISVKDSRVIWWQAIDFNFRGDSLSRADQKKVLSSLLFPFLERAGIKKPLSQPQMKEEVPSGLSPQTEEPSVTETPPASNLDKKPDKGRKPLQVPDDISPM